MLQLLDANGTQGALKIQLDQMSREMQSLRATAQQQSVVAEKQIADLQIRLNTASADCQRVLAEHQSGMLTLRELRSELEEKSSKHFQEVEMLKEYRREHEMEVLSLVANGGGCSKCALLLQQSARLQTELQTIGQRYSLVSAEWDSLREGINAERFNAQGVESNLAERLSSQFLEEQASLRQEYVSLHQALQHLREHVAQNKV